MSKPVRRRQVFYIPGYDPHSFRRYFLMFKRELALWGERNGVAASLARRKGDDGPGLITWAMRAEAPDHVVETTLNFCGWNDIAGNEFGMSYRRRLLYSIEVFAHSLTSGAFLAMFRWNWKFALFAAYPWVMASGYALVAAGWVAACVAAALRVGMPALSVPVALAVAALGLWLWFRLIRAVEPRIYVFYLLNTWIWTGRHGRRQDLPAQARFEEFAQQVAAVARAGDVDEILIVGHSSGSFVALIVAARALELVPELGRDGPRLNLLTIGANTVSACGGRRDSPGRAAIGRLLTEPRLRWIEYYTPNDIISFPRLDYRRCYAIDLHGREQVNPVMRSARMAEIFTPETWGALDWAFFKKHMQFIKANEIGGEYDFYRFLAGPERFGSAIGLGE